MALCFIVDKSNCWLVSFLNGLNNSEVLICHVFLSFTQKSTKKIIPQMVKAHYADAFPQQRGVWAASAFFTQHGYVGIHKWMKTRAKKSLQWNIPMLSQPFLLASSSEWKHSSWYILRNLNLSGVCWHLKPLPPGADTDLISSLLGASCGTSGRTACPTRSDAVFFGVS